MNEIIVDGVTYIPKNQDMRENYVIVRTYSAGVFAGYIEEHDGKKVVLRDARRLWYWEGASSLSQLAMEGVKSPDKCKFPCEVEKIVLTEAIEIINCTEVARKNISEVPVWEK
jgi:hypothetical protein